VGHDFTFQSLPNTSIIPRKRYSVKGIVNAVGQRYGVTQVLNPLVDPVTLQTNQWSKARLGGTLISDVAIRPIVQTANQLRNLAKYA
jgi:hypothetical protein